VDERLEVPHGARPAGLYEPDDNAGLAVAEGAVLAVVDMVEGLCRLVFYTGETLEELAQLPGAVRQLYENAPRLWEEFRHKDAGEGWSSRHRSGLHTSSEVRGPRDGQLLCRCLLAGPARIRGGVRPSHRDFLSPPFTMR
jgi:hypothetical protein